MEANDDRAYARRHGQARAAGFAWLRNPFRSMPRNGQIRVTRGVIDGYASVDVPENEAAGA